MPDYIAGTSAGALVGGLYAAGLSVDELIEVANSVRGGGFRRLLDFSWAKGSLVAGEKFEGFLRKNVGDVLIEDLEIPFIATAVDVNSGRGYFLDRGPLVDAIRASVSIPGIFEPVVANGGYLVDGGVRQNLPLEVLKRYRPDTLIGVDISAPEYVSAEWKFDAVRRADDEGPEEEQNLWESLKARLTKDDEKPDLPSASFLLAHSFRILAAQVAAAEIERAKPDFVIYLDMKDIELWEFGRGDEAIRMGYEQSVGQIERYLSKRRPIRSLWRRFRRWIGI